ncbi:MAG: sugar ABC transporter ATP-binding protein [Clostridiaceae bacterium]|nr:sugar ABC transporter ATP-binding protein [Clostridiaceae bacterium]
MADKYLVIKNLSKRFYGVKALSDVDFDLEKGEIHCLVGQNGSGKSTLIKIIAGVLKPDEGSSIEIMGESITDFSSSALFDKGIRVIYQDLSLFPNLTVAENIAFSSNVERGIKPVNWNRINETAQMALDKIQVKLELTALVSDLSIADRQLVAIARALTGNAKLIIMDEPTSSLTRKEVDILFSVIRDLQSKGMTILFVSHRLDEIIEIAQRITVFKDGVNMGVCTNVEIDDNKLAYMISGENISYARRFQEPDKNNVLLEVKNLSRQGEYKNINLKLYRGETLGIIGLLGSGRSELALSIFGMTRPDEGKVCVNNKAVEFKSNKEAISSGIAYVPEDRLLQGLVIDQSVERNIALTIIDGLKNKMGMINTKKRRSLTEDWVRKLNIRSAAPDINASALSGGNQQKIVISKWLATNPKILILDEPTNGVDVSAKNAIYDIIRELAKGGMGVIIISDEVPEIYYNCSRALIMHDGRIVKEIITSEISEEEFYDNVINSAE